MKNKKIRAVLVVLALLLGFCVDFYENQSIPQIDEPPAAWRSKRRVSRIETR